MFSLDHTFIVCDQGGRVVRSKLETGGYSLRCGFLTKDSQLFTVEINQFVPPVESGICLLVDVATLSTVYDVRHPLLLPPGYPTQVLISRPQAVRPPSSTPPGCPKREKQKNTLRFFRPFRYAYPSSSFRCSRRRSSLLSLACASGRLSFAVGERYYCV